MSVRGTWEGDRCHAPALRGSLVLLLLAGAGCRSSTSVALLASVDDGAHVTGLSLSVFGRFGALLRSAPVNQPHLPGRPVLYN